MLTAGRYEDALRGPRRNVSPPPFPLGVVPERGRNFHLRRRRLPSVRQGLRRRAIAVQQELSAERSGVKPARGRSAEVQGEGLPTEPSRLIRNPWRCKAMWRQSPTAPGHQGCQQHQGALPHQWFARAGMTTESVGIWSTRCRSTSPTDLRHKVTECSSLAMTPPSSVRAWGQSREHSPGPPPQR